MGKKLAIKGHSTRGEKVIELLEMMGGRYVGVLKGNNDYYVIDECEDNLIKFYEHDYIHCHNFITFTLEEFLEKYPFKVGDIIDRTLDYVSCVIDDMRWNSEKCCVEYHLNFLNGSECGWHVSECFYKPDNKDSIIKTKIESTGFMQMGKTVSVIFNSANYEDEVELQLGDYEIEVRDGRTYAVKKKPVYPKTYEECCQHLGCDDRLSTGKLVLFKKLINARNAYWKIAGEEMGLGKSWEPDWKDETQVKYMITTFNNELEFFSSIHSYVVGRRNHILSFPTKEMRDAFYENFEDLIEQCKELL